MNVKYTNFASFSTKCCLTYEPDKEQYHLCATNKRNQFMEDSHTS